MSALSQKNSKLGLCLSVFVGLAGCGSSGSNQSSSSSSLSNSSFSISSSSSDSGVEIYTSTDTSLDWNWTEEANDYCANPVTTNVVPGTFEVLRPESSDVLHSSEHFVLRWNHNDGVNINQNTINQALQTLESVWDVYIDQLNFPEPYWDSATKYKVSVNVSDEGYASGAGTGERDPEMWVHYDALQHVGTLAHEFAHTLQFTTRSMRDSQYVGWLWESHANWMAHQFNPQDVQCTEAMVNAPHIYYGSTRNRYCNWQFFEFLKDNTCPEFVNDALWKNGLKPETPGYATTDPFSTLATNAHWSTEQLNDIFADWALHNVHWDYTENGDTYRSRYGSNADESNSRRYRVTRLQPTGRQGQYEVPAYWAPQRWGYNLVRLKPLAGSDALTLDFEGVVQESPAVSHFANGAALQPRVLAAPDSQWRWSVVVTDRENQPRYSMVQRGVGGRLEVQLQPGDQSVWLVVMATPIQIQKIFWDQIYYSIYRYPWRISLEGAEPALFADSERDLSQLAGRGHANGGGFVASSASVSDSVFVGPNARILGHARLTGTARVEGFAVVKGSAQVSDSAIVRDYALVAGNARIGGSSIIEGHAAVLDGQVSERARVGALSIIQGASSVIAGDAVVSTTMNTIHSRRIGGSAQLYGDLELNADVVDRGVFYGYVDNQLLGDPAYGADRTAPVPEITQSQ